MQTKLFFIASMLAVFTSTTGFSHDSQPQNGNTAVVINQIMDDFHDAADKGDKVRYLGHFAKNGVFMGTDDWERWPYLEFSAYVNKHFKDGKGWSYTPVKRFVNFDKQHSIAWIDEIVMSDQWGRFRGTAVLEKIDLGWKIKHYSLTKLVPNESWEAVSEITQKAFTQRRVQVGEEPSTNVSSESK